MNQMIQPGGFMRPTKRRDLSMGEAGNKDYITNEPSRWTTPWHDHVGTDGILALCGRFRVILEEDQWILERLDRRWRPISYHRECQSLLRVLRERQSMKGNGHLVGDLRALHEVLEAML